MHRKVRTWKLVGSLLVGVMSLLTWASVGWTTTRVGNAELQAWYRMRHTFHSNGGEDLNWVQWRNEFFGWLIYDDLIKDGQVFEKVNLPLLNLVEDATLNARYRFRFDPVYMLREHFDENLYDDDEKDSFIIPENGFRDLFVDLDFGQVGPGYLSARVGNQQIVWGESDLYRSIDIINPLRIDQNTGAGEKFDEFRSPILALKLLYEIGNVGRWFSNVAIEPFWTPRYRTLASDLLLEGGFRLPQHIRGCLDENDRVVAYDPIVCSNLRSSNGERVFVSYRPSWLAQQRIRHPWSIFAWSPNPTNGTPDFICLTARCSPDEVGDRASIIANLAKRRDQHVLHGFGGHSHAGGVRVLGTSIWGVDFSLNYMYITPGSGGTLTLSRGLLNPLPNQSATVPFGMPVYGDPDEIAEMFGDDVVVGGSFTEGLRRCLSDGGKNHFGEGRIGQPNARGHKSDALILAGADLNGYNHPERFQSRNKNGALQDDGRPLPNRHQSKRPLHTLCHPAKHNFFWTHVVGFTLTYNDFDYTGAVFRAEQSLSTKELLRRRLGATLRDGNDRWSRVWRSMIGFDLLRSFGLFRYIPGLHRSFYQQQWFLSGQWLMQYYLDNATNTLCSHVDDGGNGLTAEDVRQERANGFRAYSDPACRVYRWNHLFTLGLGTNGLYGGRVETRNAVAFEPRAQEYLLFSQWWWRNVLGYRNLELSTGVSWYPGSGMGTSWSGIQHYGDRDQFWFEFTYYLL